MSASHEDEESSNGAGKAAKAPEFEPPASVVARIIKNVAPNMSMTKDARAAFTRAAGIFIFYITHCANDFCKDAKRQTIQGQDIKNAIRELDFEELEKPLEEFMQAYRKEEAKRARDAKAKKEGAAGTTETEEEEDENMEGDDDKEEDAEKEEAAFAMEE